MLLRYRFMLTVALALTTLPGLALAKSLGDGRLSSVVPSGGSYCVAGPTGDSVQRWDVQPGGSYTITLSNVADCGNGGTDATINVRVNSTGSGNTDIVATLTGPGQYSFTYNVPVGASCSMSIFYCTTPGKANSGFLVRRSDGGDFKAHFRAATFDAGCTNPQSIVGPNCQ